MNESGVPGEWLAMAAATSVGHLKGLGLTDHQLAAIDWLLFENKKTKLLIPRNGDKPPAKPLTFMCGCGCGETVRTTYRTKRPKYKNAAHRDRAYRRRKGMVKGVRLQPVMV